MSHCQALIHNTANVWPMIEFNTKPTFLGYYGKGTISYYIYSSMCSSLGLSTGIKVAQDTEKSVNHPEILDQMDMSIYVYILSVFQSNHLSIDLSLS